MTLETTNECWIYLPDTSLSKRHGDLLVSGHVPSWQINQKHFQQCTLHRRIQKPARSMGGTQRRLTIFTTAWTPLITRRPVP